MGCYNEAYYAMTSRVITLLDSHNRKTCRESGQPELLTGDLHGLTLDPDRPVFLDSSALPRMPSSELIGTEHESETAGVKFILQTNIGSALTMQFRTFS